MVAPLDPLARTLARNPMTDGELIILGVIMVAAGAIIGKLELILAHLNGDPEEALNLREVVAALLVVFGGFALAVVGAFRVFGVAL